LIAAIEFKLGLAATVLAYDVHGAADADHELRTEPMRVLAALRADRRGQGEHAFDLERHLGGHFSHHHLAVISGMAWQSYEPSVT
jgi:hypothetical protein